MDKLKIRDLDDLELAQIIEDHFGSQNLKKYPSGSGISTDKSGVSSATPSSKPG